MGLVGNKGLYYTGRAYIALFPTRCQEGQVREGKLQRGVKESTNQPPCFRSLLLQACRGFWGLELWATQSQTSEEHLINTNIYIYIYRGVLSGNIIKCQYRVKLGNIP